MDKDTLARLRAERRLLQRAIVAIERYQRAQLERERCEEVLPALAAAGGGGAIDSAVARLRLVRDLGGERSSCARFLGRGCLTLLQPTGDRGPDPEEQA